MPAFHIYTIQHEWSSVRDFHAAILLEIEQGHLRWGDSFAHLERHSLHVKPRSLITQRSASTSSSFKAIHGQAPDYICNLICVKNPSLYGLRSNSQVLLVPSMKTKKTLGDRAFTAPAPSLWNKLPCAIREEDNFNHFKFKLKTFLFRKAFE